MRAPSILWPENSASGLCGVWRRNAMRLKEYIKIFKMTQPVKGLAVVETEGRRKRKEKK